MNLENSGAINRLQEIIVAAPRYFHFLRRTDWPNDVIREARGHSSSVGCVDHCTVNTPRVRSASASTSQSVIATEATRTHVRNRKESAFL